MILSHGVFGEQLSTGQVLKACPRLFMKQVFLSLTWRRLSPYRSMDIAVVQLENLHGTERGKRLDVLHRDGHAPAKWLTLIGVHVESFFVLAIASLLYALVPKELHLDLFDLEFWFESRMGLSLQALFYYLAVAAVAPFYVACGFSLYLNRRVKLEGWDIEIAFKQMLIKRGLGASLITLLLCAVMGTLPIFAEQTWAQETSSRPPNTEMPRESERIQEEIQAILTGQDFQQKSLQKVLRFKQQEPLDDEQDLSFTWLKPIVDAIAWLLTATAAVAEVLLWAVVIGGSIYFAVKYRSWLAKLANWRGAPRRHHYQPQALFGMDVRAESLPDNISASAEALWQQQDFRAALALLYRASLAKLLEHGLPLQEGTTEQECLLLAQTEGIHRGMPQHTLAYFEELTGAWRRLAYGHQTPDTATGLYLCGRWNPLWAEGDHGH